MRYWWVNHKQTARQEVGEGYLWSPVLEAPRKSDGVRARSQFYDNMRIAAPGDAVLSYADGQIGCVGCVTDFAVPAPKPDIFGTTGAYWSVEGWLLPVAWQTLPAPVRPKQFMEALRPLLPAKYSPINAKDGKGNQKAYLAEISQQIFDLLLPGYVLTEHVSLDTPSSVVAVEDAIETKIKNDLSLNETVRQQTVLARKGQGLFKTNVIAHGGNVCRLTGVANPALLVASHIKPWRMCETSAERLDGANGLLLAAHVDRLFDRGFISFEDDGRVLVSSAIDELDLQRMGLNRISEIICDGISDEQYAYINYHRNKVFVKKQEDE